MTDLEELKALVQPIPAERGVDMLAERGFGFDVTAPFRESSNGHQLTEPEPEWEEEPHPSELEPNPFPPEEGAESPEADPEAARLHVVPLEAFVKEQEASAEPLLGSEEEMAVAAGGTLILYGDGGTSKTTLTIDAMVHLAAGVDWLGLCVPRPLVVLVIENEGPRGPFRRKLARELESWAGESFADRVHVLEEPWAGFSFAEETHRAELAAFVDETEVDLIVCGPLAALGAVGGGTPDEVSAFEHLLGDLRSRCKRPVALWLCHHENKAGDVSGAWERLPDTLVHARLDGKERTRIHWRKARWSSSLHDKRWTLAWTAGEGFELVDEEASEEAKAAQLEEDRERVVAYVSEHPGESKSAAETVFAEAEGRGGRARARRAIEAELTASTPRLAKGPGKSPNGTYLYPASEANSPTRGGANGEYGEYGSDPFTETLLANSPPPEGGERYGELADGVDESLEQDEELTWR